MCPLTTRHEAVPSSDSRGEWRELRSDLSGVETTRKLRRDVHPGGLSGPRSTIAASLWPSPRAVREWQSDVTSQGYYDSSGTKHFHTQRAEEESGPGVAASGTTRSTWNSVCKKTRGSARGRERVLGRSDARERTAQNNEVTAERGEENRAWANSRHKSIANSKQSRRCVQSRRNELKSEVTVQEIEQRCVSG